MPASRHFPFAERMPLSSVLELQVADKRTRLKEGTVFLEKICDVAGTKPVTISFPALVGVCELRGGWNILGQMFAARRFASAKRTPLSLAIEFETADKCPCLAKWTVFL